MKGIIKQTFQVYREQLGKFIALSALLVGIFQVLLQWLSGSIQGMMSQNSDLFYLLYAALNKMPFHQIAQSEVDVMSFNIVSMFAMLLMMMVVSLAYGVFITPLFSWSTIRLTQKSQSIGEVFQSLKGKYWALVLVALCQMVYMMGAGTAILILYFICAIPIIILANITMMGSAKIGLIIAFVIVIVVCILLILAAIAIISILAMFIYPSFIIDDQRNFSAVGRSMKVAWSQFWTILGKYVVMLLIITLAVVVLGGIFALPIIIGNVYSPWLWFGYLFVLTAITSPLTLILATLMYQRLSPQIPLKPKKENETEKRKLTVEAN